MSYDIYCYKSKKDAPDIREAEAFINLENEISNDEAEKNKIAECLMKVDPKLERFTLDYDAIAKSQNITTEEAKSKFDYVELNSPEDDLPFQFHIENNNLTITLPYWYSEEKKAKELFEKTKEYLQSIYDCVGWYTYDPQTEQVFLAKGFDIERATGAYIKGTGMLQEKVAQTNTKQAYPKKQIIIIAILIALGLLRVLLNRYIN